MSVFSKCNKARGILYAWKYPSKQPYYHFFKHKHILYLFILKHENVRFTNAFSKFGCDKARGMLYAWKHGISFPVNPSGILPKWQMQPKWPSIIYLRATYALLREYYIGAEEVKANPHK